MTGIDMAACKDVTIIIPIYIDREEGLMWLGECLESASNQGSQVVAWDDGSPIDVSSIVSKYPTVRYFKGAHKGVSAARNSAISQAHTELILPLDCDDRLEKDAVTRLLKYWDGITPVYPDVAKFGKINIPHYVLLDFSCDNIFKYVGFSSVNVLHRKSQWEEIGGYDESIDFYEDGEYNARLYLKWCGMHCPQPLVHYRIRAGQRTDLYKSKSAEYAKRIMKKIGGYEMACPSCRGKRRTANLQATTPIPVEVDVNSLPLTSGDSVLAQYVGGVGRGKHYCNGPVTGKAYKVKFGMYLYVHPSDVRKPGEISPTPFVKVTRNDIVAAPPAPTPEPTPAQAPQPVESFQVPVNEDMDFEEIAETEPEDLPEIRDMTVAQIKSLDMNPELAGKLLSMEKNGLNRGKVIAYLESQSEQW